MLSLKFSTVFSHQRSRAFSSSSSLSGFLPLRASHIAAAAATGRDAITFNAANFNFELYGIYDSLTTANITNYYIENEILSSLIFPASIGETKYVKSGNYITYNVSFLLWEYSVTLPDYVENHRIDTFIETWGVKYP